MNFVVLTAALSSAVANLYFGARLAFSLARGGYLPAILGRLSKEGMPVVAVLTSAGGMAAALVLSEHFKDSLFVFMVGLSTFGALFAWLMTLLTHLAFRRLHKRQAKPYLRLGPRGPWASLAGLAGVLAVLVSTWWVPGFRITCWPAYPGWLLSQCATLFGEGPDPTCHSVEFRAMDELLKWRGEFPILDRTTYMISNSLGAMPRGVYDEMRVYADSWAERGVRAWEEGWWEMAVGVGDRIAPLIGAGPGEISLHQNVTLTQAVISSCFVSAVRATRL